MEVGSEYSADVFLIGAGPQTETLRRAFVQRGIEPRGVTSHLRGLRRWLATTGRPSIICIGVNNATPARFGCRLAAVLNDYRHPAQAVMTVAIPETPAYSAAAAQLGCHLCLNNVYEIMRIGRQFVAAHAAWSIGERLAAGESAGRLRLDRECGARQGDQGGIGPEKVRIWRSSERPLRNARDGRQARRQKAVEPIGPPAPQMCLNRVVLRRTT